MAERLCAAIVIERFLLKFLKFLRSNRDKQNAAKRLLALKNGRQEIITHSIAGGSVDLVVAKVSILVFWSNLT